MRLLGFFLEVLAALPLRAIAPSTSAQVSLGQLCKSVHVVIQQQLAHLKQMQLSSFMQNVLDDRRTLLHHTASTHPFHSLARVWLSHDLHPSCHVLPIFIALLETAPPDIFLVVVLDGVSALHLPQLILSTVVYALTVFRPLHHVPFDDLNLLHSRVRELTFQALTFSLSAFSLFVANARHLHKLRLNDCDLTDAHLRALGACFSRFQPEWQQVEFLENDFSSCTVDAFFAMLRSEREKDAPRYLRSLRLHAHSTTQHYLVEWKANIQGHVHIVWSPAS